MVTEQIQAEPIVVENDAPPQVSSSIEILDTVNRSMATVGNNFTIVAEAPRTRLTWARNYMKEQSGAQARGDAIPFEITLPWMVYVVSYYAQRVISVYATNDKKQSLYPVPLPSISYSPEGSKFHASSVRTLCVRGGKTAFSNNNDDLVNAGMLIEEFWQSTFRYFTFKATDADEVTRPYCWIFDVPKVEDLPKGTNYYGGTADIDVTPAFERWEGLTLDQAIKIPWSKRRIGTVRLLREYLANKGPW